MSCVIIYFIFYYIYFSFMYSIGKLLYFENRLYLMFIFAFIYTVVCRKIYVNNIVAFVILM